ncbi:Alpha/Beta hydrolase protein [Phyllosticta capitalensis]
MASYDTIPSTAKTQPTPFKVNIPQEKLHQLEQLVKLSPIGPETYENLFEDRKLGVSRSWLESAKKEWESFDWRSHEAHINSFPHFTLPVTDDDGRKHSVHFVALFSTNPSAAPVAFFHGWPGSFLEFLPILSLLKSQYAPDQLPFHVIVPSLSGYTFSGRPPKDKDWTMQDEARIMHKFMCELGFEKGYVTQGGDIGSFIARIMGAENEACKAVHLNFSPMQKPDSASDSDINELEAFALKRGAEFQRTGFAYAMEHGTRPATIGLVLSSSPIALLAWIGEKFLTWTDADPPVSAILESISLYWLTDSFPTSIWSYRQHYGPNPIPGGVHGNAKFRLNKPFGYSFFPYELMAMPKAWVQTNGDLVFWRQHERGGHFAAMEKPDELLKDVTDFVTQVWK